MKRLSCVMLCDLSSISCLHSHARVVSVTTQCSLKPGFHIIAPVATIAAVVEKRVSATVAIYGNILFSDSSDRYDSGDERR